MECELDNGRRYRPSVGVDRQRLVLVLAPVLALADEAAQLREGHVTRRSRDPGRRPPPRGALCRTAATGRAAPPGSSTRDGPTAPGRPCVLRPTTVKRHGHTQVASVGSYTN